RLISTLTHELIRVLRTYVASMNHLGVAADALGAYLERVKVFLSHSKHDPYGERIAWAILDFLSKNSALSQLFDVRDIPAGLPFPTVIERFVRRSAVVAIYTDSYSSREWCRREIIEAKRADRPLIVADCITEIDERSFPYLGNVPVVRMEPEAMVRIPFVVARLLDEIFKDFLWSARLAHDGRSSDGAVCFLPRSPELIALANLRIAAGAAPPTIVYPDPPLGAEELQLFHDARADLTLLAYTEYVAAYGGAP
ncbi:MAG TPA: toll/interleukin-1 receptor domain-containing protein, partial [Candidatus Cybelea sp.]